MKPSDQQSGVEIKVSPFTGTPPSKRNIKGVADRIDADVYARYSKTRSWAENFEKPWIADTPEKVQQANDLREKLGQPPVRLGDNTAYAPIDWARQ